MFTKRIRWDGKEPLKVGHVVTYWYCRGTAYKGIAVMQGQCDFEYWMKTLDGENHFGHRNFIITTDVSLCECSEDDFEANKNR
jgi:hypothetical protein